MLTRETRRAEVEARLKDLNAPRPNLDYSTLREQLEGYLVDWRRLLTANVQQGQAGLATVGKRSTEVSPLRRVEATN